MHRALIPLGVPLLLAAQDPPARLVKIAEGLDQPVHIVSPRDGTGRLFVVEQRGRIRMLESQSRAPVFLDISGRVRCCGERGLLGLAFPPGFAEKSRFYVYYTDPAGDIVVSRFGLLPSGLGDPGSEEVILTIAHRQFGNHNGGQLVFGPDGYLYIGTGDGGGGGDPLGNAQNPNSLLGKLLRLDVESGATPYNTPGDNPFVSRAGYRPEVWALGLRNPWRFSFDRANGDLFIADVGQGSYEEINWQPAASGGGENYGWNVMEGLHCFSGPCSQSGLTLPVAEYSHAAGDCSVTGGFVYRGMRIPALQGIYLYSDYCSGRIRALSRQGQQWRSEILLSPGFPVSSFGEDEAGEVYLADHAGGNIHRFETGATGLTATSVVNAASYLPGLSPGSLATLFGSNLSLPPGSLVAEAFPLPGELAGLSVLVNGIPAPVFSASNVPTGEQVSFQIPNETRPGRATVRVVRGGQPSPPVDVDVLPVAPGLFSVGEYAAALRADYTPLAVCSPDCPAVEPGEIVLLYGTGLGPVDSPPATGAAAPDAPLSRTVLSPSVAIGGKPATVLFSGLAPRFAGLYQVNVQLAPDTPSGVQDIVLTVDGRSSKPAKIRVR